MRTWTAPGWGPSDEPPRRNQGDGCARCGAGGALREASIVPYHKGGRKTPGNRQWLCRHCLRLKRLEDH